RAPRSQKRVPVPTFQGRIQATYGLTLSSGESPEARAKAIAFEQTVELPPERVPDELVSGVVGQVERLEPGEGDRWLATISYSSTLAGGSFSQLMNLLYGNISLLSGVRLLEVEWPDDLLARFPGPRFGLEGLRDLCGVEARRPLTCAVSKPLGLSSRQLAELVGLLARAGIDIIKDDHSLADQLDAPFRERVAVCQKAVEEVNRSEGTSAVYFPSLVGRSRELVDNVGFLQERGCRGAVVIPFYMGLDTMAGLAADSDLALLAHPSGSGVFFNPEHGVAPEVYLGQVLRIAGCDAVIYPHAGGRFRMDEASASAIRSNLLGELGTLRPSAPAPGGSIETAALVEWLDLYGPDSVFVVGSSVARAEDPTAAAEELVSTVRDAFV
ncbi:MAG: RuBisCO large subunit C-terminal-like domain-containing protein, partial [Thermoanaerobaculia bacterium]